MGNIEETSNLSTPGRNKQNIRGILLSTSVRAVKQPAGGGSRNALLRSSHTMTSVTVDSSVSAGTYLRDSYHRRHNQVKYVLKRIFRFLQVRRSSSAEIYHRRSQCI